jgi:hypothetical protein
MMGGANMLDARARQVKLAVAATATCVFAPTSALAHTWPSSRDDASSALPSIGAFTVTGAPIATAGSPRAELVFLGDPPAELSTQEVVDAMGRAADAWSQVPCAYVEVGVAGVGQAAGLTDGQVPVVFLDPSDSPTCFPSGPERVAAAPCPIGETFGVALNARDYTWAPAPDQGALVLDGETRYAVDAVVTHELGHVLGLGHTDVDPLATMAASYLVDGGQLTLGADDRRGLCALYPVDDPPECGSDAECVAELGDPGATCDTSASPRVCEEERGEVGDYCSSALQVCPGTCLETSGARTGYCTVGCDASNTASCPAGFVCEARDFTDGTSRDLCVHEVEPSEDPTSCAAAPAGRPVTAWWILALAWGSRWARRRSRRAGS